MRIAIMQPYFLPYAGYFRLFSETDLFVIYDCVQFIRRGWIHRNKFLNRQGELSWLTLPLKKAPREIRVSELAFSETPEKRLLEQQKQFPIFTSKPYLMSAFSHALFDFSLHPVAYIINLLKLTCNTLQIPFTISLSSQLQLPSDLKSQDRIIAIAKHFNADSYINPPGGKELYNKNDFKRHNINLHFLPEYSGPYESILSRLLSEEISTLKNEICRQGIDKSMF
jgi:hypothetical protein